MGLFSTVFHLYKKSQGDIISELSNALRQDYALSSLSRVDITNDNYKHTLDNNVIAQKGLFYLVTHAHDDWTTIIELHVNVDNPFYLYQLTNNLSKRLNTYALSFHLHDDDVLYYNLDKKGESLDGYNSNFQYFLTEPARTADILSQRHAPQRFLDILPVPKKAEALNEILNEGYWNAFDCGDLDEEGVPNEDNYFVDEEDRFLRVGKFLEIFSKDDYPFANWHSNLTKLQLHNCYLLKADR
jgi:hypothetical protein